MNFLILGSGYGLYGYLPSIYKISKKIFLDIKYKKKIKFIDNFKKIEWYNNMENILSKINYVVIAKRPNDQFKLVEYIHKKNKTVNFFLEKPLAATPSKAKELLFFLKRKKILFKVGFIFSYLKWYDLIFKNFNYEKSKILIEWNFKYNKNNNSWKKKPRMGGGIIAYYGIHFIKIFSDLNFKEIKENILEKYTWRYVVSDKNSNLIKLIININSKKEKFIIRINNKVLRYQNPFDAEIIGTKKDPRCKYLTKYVLSGFINSKEIFNKHLNCIKLWSNISKSLN